MSLLSMNLGPLMIKLGVLCYAIFENPTKTINFPESLKFKIEKPFKSYVLAPVLFLIDIWYRSIFPSIRYSYR